MKKITTFISLLFALNFVYGQQTFSQAKQKAKLENKFILINFSGSDWCIPCISMQKEFFENSAFNKMADSMLIVIRADFPRKKKNMPAKEIMAQNELLADKYNPNGSFPFTLLIAPDEKIIKAWEGKPDETAEVFSNSIRAFILQHKQQ
jgi:uncharacterized protein YyaL (SSP411 family)